MSLIFLLLRVFTPLGSQYDEIVLMFMVQLDYIAIMETLRWRRLKGR
jgi:hypothetical protein